MSLSPRMSLSLVAQISLVFAAVISMPLGARDSDGVSDILPPLRQAPTETNHVEQAASADRADLREQSRALAISAVLVVAVVAVRRSTGRRTEPLPATPLRSRTVVPLGGRAPPFPV